MAAADLGPDDSEDNVLDLCAAEEDVASLPEVCRLPVCGTSKNCRTSYSCNPESPMHTGWHVGGNPACTPRDPWTSASTVRHMPCSCHATGFRLQAKLQLCPLAA